jgi:hypothetical protein
MGARAEHYIVFHFRFIKDQVNTMASFARERAEDSNNRYIGISIKICLNSQPNY